jgi:hypothetical protein
MIRRPPLITPRALDVKSSDELGSNISPNALKYNGETESQKHVRERKNKLKEGRRRRARQRKEAWTRYEFDLAEYDRMKLEREAEERYTARKANNSPYDIIRELAKELNAISHPNEEQERLREVLWSIALRAHNGRARSRLPARSASHRQENQSQRRSAFERLGPNGGYNRESRRNHSQSNRFEQSRESRSRIPDQTAPQNHSHQNDSWQEGGAESEYREAGAHDRFPCFAS